MGSSSFDNNEAGNDIDGRVMSVDYSSFKVKETVGNNCIQFYQKSRLLQV